MDIADDLSDLTPEEREELLLVREELRQALSDPNFVDPDPEATEAAWEEFKMRRDRGYFVYLRWGNGWVN